jgi:exopolysaccharide production protein ExoQ
MSQHLALTLYIFVILALFFLDRDKQAKCSAALWVPIIWMLLSSSRSVSQWMQLGERINVADMAQQVAEGNPIDRVVYLGLEAVGIAILLARGARIVRFLRANTAILSFFALCLASLLWSDFPDVALKRWTKALGDLIMVLIVLSDQDMFFAIRRFLARTGFVLIPLSVLFVKYYPEYGKSYGRYDYKPYYQGVTLNKNMLGAICVIFGLASIWRLLALLKEPRSLRIRHLLAHATILGMVLWLFHIANSMTSFNCFLMASALLILASTRFVIRRPAIAHCAAATIVIGAISVLFLGIGEGMLNSIGRDSTLTDRTAIWTTVLPLAPSKLFGAGFESFWLGPRLQKIWAMFPWQPFEAHNGYIEILLSLGWIGIAWLAVVMGTGYMAVSKVYRCNPKLGNLWLCLFVVGLIYNCTEAAFFRMMAPVWIMLLMAMVQVAPTPSAKAPGHDQSTSRSETVGDLAQGADSPLVTV